MDPVVLDGLPIVGGDIDAWGGKVNDSLLQLANAINTLANLDVDFSHPLAAVLTARGFAVASALVDQGGSSRWVGTVNGTNPSSGSHLAGDWVLDLTGGFRICISPGSPGTWVNVRPHDFDTSLPAALGTAAPGTSAAIAHADHVHATELGSVQGAALGLEGRAGVASTGSRSDHVHPASAAQYSNSGQIGALSPSRWVGAVVGANPAGGPWNGGDWVTDLNGGFRMCIAAGSPGIWVYIPALGSSAPAAVGTTAVGAALTSARSDHAHADNATTVHRTTGSAPRINWGLTTVNTDAGGYGWINHGLGITPGSVQLTGVAPMGGANIAAQNLADSYNVTSFRVRSINQDGGANASMPVTVSWTAYA